ncbi:hypothetical protein N8I77_009652 [Diaporthe amygdali]|uniref:Trichothecene 3-O-acetyltransferase-like N-terminal domain-containing protein n=1 Tax=Phomopsis amygdali TaxID=1214568 RepID=A0AAD9SA88_PHOAM|nr:hypothetical protein N8I77_009652 [Diaporthe amygdali]
MSGHTANEQEVVHLHPTGWERDPEEERFKLSTLDYLVGCVYVSYAVFFKIDDDAAKPKVAQLLKQGLERTLSQTRHLCGTIEKDADGGHSFVKNRDSTVKFVTKWLDQAEKKGRSPSFSDLEKNHFVSRALSDISHYSVSPMTYGEKPEAYLDNHPKVAAFQANFIRGGLVFMMHHHHTANDIMGWAGELHQLAENCAAIWNRTVFPAWDPACLDVSIFTKKEYPADQQVEGPISPEKHPDHRKSQWLLFHLPKSRVRISQYDCKKYLLTTLPDIKAAELKKLASPADDSYWISTYDAFQAFAWRVFSRLRAKVYKPDLSSTPLWGEAVDMRKRCHDPAVPARIQHNVVGVALSPQTPVPPLTVAEIISDVPLSKLAWFVRQMTNSTTQESLDKTLDAIAPVRDKSVLYLRCDSFAPMYNFTTDWRDSNIAGADFGFAKPYAFRHPMDFVTPGLQIVYPPLSNDPGSDEGPELCVGFEKELTKDLIEDAEWSKYFEFRGIDAEDAD